MLSHFECRVASGLNCFMSDKRRLITKVYVIQLQTNNTSNKTKDLVLFPSLEWQRAIVLRQVETEALSLIAAIHEVLDPLMCLQGELKRKL